MICNTQQEFEQAISGMITPDAILYKKITSNLMNANRWMQHRLLGAELYAKYDSFSDVLKESCISLVAHKAMVEAIPTLDIRLTTAGFGVVMGRDMAPASQERVKNLTKQLNASADMAIDFLIPAFIQDNELQPLFAKSPLFDVLTESLILTGGDLELFCGYKAATYSDLKTRKVEVIQAENELIKRLSIEYHRELIDKQRTNAFTTADKEVVRRAKYIIGCYMKANTMEAWELGNELQNLMEATPEEYPTYMDSQVYELKMKDKYANKKDSTCFFFGA